MESGFSFELYDKVYENCFIHSSYYKNGNLQLSLFGLDPETNEMTHFTDITLEQDRRSLYDNEIIVDCKFKPTFVTQLIDLGILKEQIGIYAENSSIYPIYTIDLSNIVTSEYCMQELIAA